MREGQEQGALTVRQEGAGEVDAHEAQGRNPEKVSGPRCVWRVVVVWGSGHSLGTSTNRNTHYSSTEL